MSAATPQELLNDFYTVDQRRFAASISDVVTMSQSGLADDLIINHIHRNGVQYMAWPAG